MNKDNTKQEKKEKKEPILRVQIPVFLFPKAKKDDVSLCQLLAYSWIYTKNLFAKGGIYGKFKYKSLFTEMEADLCVNDASKLCSNLVKAGWLQKAAAEPFKDQRQVGYLCMLDTKQRSKARAKQQEMTLTDEETVIEVESSVDDSNGVYIKFGWPYYEDAEGNEVQLPKTVPPRPSTTAVWVSDPEGWYEPEDIPTHDLEF